MKLFGLSITREQRASAEDPRVPVSAENFLAFFGAQSVTLPHVTIDSALTVPAVWAAVAFLSRTLATLPLHVYRKTDGGPVKLDGKLEKIIHDMPNPEMDSFKFRQYFWQQVFTGGRGLAWLEWNATQLENIWPMDPARTIVKRVGQRKVYQWESKEYPAEDVIDIPFMLKSDGLLHYGPVMMAARAIQLALAMNEYGSKFFAGGGVPPLALSGPLPVGPEALKRAMADVNRPSMRRAKATSRFSRCRPATN
jgi:HK97 family phage portal protein